MHILIKRCLVVADVAAAELVSAALVLGLDVFVITAYLRPWAESPLCE